jgi:hypothetical protein
MARPRPSLESDRLHLLSPSTATSRAASLLSHRSSVVTLKPTQTQTTQPLTKSATAARRFTKSEEEYLDALRAWVEEKQYISLGEDLQGFYGRKTMDMYAAKEGPNWGRKKRGKSTGQKDITAADLDSNGRRRTIAVAVAVPERVQEEQKMEAKRRMSVRGWLRR